MPQKLREPIHTPEEIARELRYDPETGEFWWLIRRHKRRLDRPAGSTSPHRAGLPARGICIDGRRYYGNVLAWVLMTGEWPTITVDHIDRNPLNNRWENLRLATQSEQNMNRGVDRPGLTGASFHKHSRLWQAYIKAGGKRITLGYFKTAEEAHAAYLKAAKELHGIFSPYHPRTGRPR